jgi:epoxide hydrolase
VSDDIHPFRIDVPDADLDDLRDRLRRTRWPEPEPVTDWSQGIPLAYTRELCDYWLKDYDWRAAEARLNSFAQFRTEIDGVDIHFIHVRSPRPDAWHELMRRLGYRRYGAQGGDWGSTVTTALAIRHPERLVGIHLNMVTTFPDRAALGADLTGREQAALASLAHYNKEDSGYSKEQSTRPQTIGYGLVDSPAALCAWIVEKFWSWTDCDGDPASVLTRDEMLDNIMLYWLPGTGASAARLYWESFRKPLPGPVTVPVGCSIFPKEIFRPSRRWAGQRFPRLHYWNELDRGGHFAAFEQPGLFTGEVRAAFRPLRG